MSRSLLGFLIKVLWLTALFTTILIALFGISNKRFQPNSHLDKSETRIQFNREKQSIPPDKGDTAKPRGFESQQLLTNPEFQQDLHNLIAPEHRDAYVDALKTKERCSLDQNTCDKIIWDGDYNVVQQLRYQTITIGLINTLDALLKEGTTTKQCLDRLKLYKNELASRGSATHTTIKMNTQPVESYREYRQVLTHELGHIVDLCSLEGQSKKQDNLFTEFGEKAFGIDDNSLDFYALSRLSERVRKKWSSSKDFISGYASKNPFEDFAESQNAYLNHPEKFRFLASKNSILSKKYQYFDALYGGNHFDVEEFPTKVKNSNKRVWDTTRWEE